MEQLSGLDASFLYLETPTLHMHVEMVTVFDPSTVPGGYSFAKMQAQIASRTHQAPVFRRLLVEVPFRLGHPVGWTTPTSTSTTTSVAPPSPRREASASSPTSPVTSPAASSTGPSPVGDLGGRGAREGADRGHRQDAPLDRRRDVGAALLSVLFDLEVDPGPEPEPPAATVPVRIPRAPSWSARPWPHAWFRPSR